MTQKIIGEAKRSETNGSETKRKNWFLDFAWACKNKPKRVTFCFETKMFYRRNWRPPTEDCGPHSLGGSRLRIWDCCLVSLNGLSHHIPLVNNAVTKCLTSLLRHIFNPYTIEPRTSLKVGSIMKFLWAVHKNGGNAFSHRNDIWT
jgi:hypothetical protein